MFAFFLGGWGREWIYFLVTPTLIRRASSKPIWGLKQLISRPKGSEREFNAEDPSRESKQGLLAAATAGWDPQSRWIQERTDCLQQGWFQPPED